MRHRFPGAFGCALCALTIIALPYRAHAAATTQEVERAEHLALEGDAGAQVALGILHETGDGLPQNSTEASKWFRRAAEQGDAEGCFRLGWLYARGEGLPRDLEQAVRWYQIAAEKGHAVAQLSLGWLYLNDEGIARDVALAAQWFTRAAEHGDANAEYTLGMIYSGAYDGVETDHGAAAKWFQRAASRGMAGAQFRLGAMYAAGEGVGVDENEAYFWLSLAIARLPGGAFKNDAETGRAQIAERLSASERDEIEKRAAKWQPTAETS